MDDEPDPESGIVTDATLGAATVPLVRPWSVSVCRPWTTPDEPLLQYGPRCSSAAASAPFGLFYRPTAMPVVGDVCRGCPPIGACEGAREQTKTRSITTTPVPVQLAVGRFHPAQPKHAGGPPLCRTGGSWNGAFGIPRLAAMAQSSLFMDCNISYLFTS